MGCSQTARAVWAWCLVLLACVVVPSSVSGSSCSVLSSTSVCGAVYTGNVTLATCSDAQASAVSELPALLAGIANSSCAAAVAAVTCAQVYPPCGTSGPCTSLCSTALAACGGSGSATVTALAQAGVSLNCSTFATSECYATSVTPVALPAEPQCTNYTSTAPGGFCASVFPSSLVYVPADSTFAELEATVTALGALISYLPSSSAGSACKRALRKQICSNVFLGCDADVLPSLGVAIDAPLPRFECRSDCDAYNAVCIDSGLLSTTVTSSLSTAALAFLRPNCTGTGAKVPATDVCGVKSAALEDFPVTATVYPASSSLPSLTVTCNTDLAATSSLPAPATLIQSLSSHSFCSTVLPTNYTAAVDVYGTCQDHQENALSSLPLIMSALTNTAWMAEMGISSSCAVSLAELACVATYPNSAGEPPCASMCSAVVAECGYAVALLAEFFSELEDCTALPTTDCYAPVTEADFEPTIPSPPQCINYTESGGTWCADVLTYPVYLPADTTFAYLEASFESLSFLYNLLPLTAIGNNCYRQFTVQLCRNLFLGCDDTVTSLAPLPFPRFESRYNCELYAASCAFPSTYLDQMPTVIQEILSPNCTGSGVKYPAGSACGVATGTAALEDFPEYNTTFPSPIDGLVLVTQVTTISAAEIVADIDIVSHCPYPLRAPVDPSDAISDTSCAVPCPLPMYSNSEYHTVDAWNVSFVVIGFTFNLFLLITWLFFEVKRKQIYVLMFCINIFMLSFPLFLGVLITGGHASKIGCKTATCGLVQSDYQHFCPWQAGILQLAALGAAFWWSVIAFDLFLVLVVGLRLSKEQKRLKNMFYFAYASGLPIILVIIVAAKSGLAYNTTLSWCFVGSDAASWVEYVTFWAPMIACILVGAGCIISLFWVLFKSSRATGNDKKRGAWKQYVRPLLFLSEFCAIFAFVCSYKFNYSRFGDEYTADFTSWVTCLMGSDGSIETCGEHNTLRPSPGLWTMMHFGLAGQGILNWIVYGTQMNNYTLWIDYCRAGLRPSQRGSGGSRTGGSTGGSRHTDLERTATGVEMKRGASNKDLVSHNGASRFSNIAGGGGGGGGALARDRDEVDMPSRSFPVTRGLTRTLQRPTPTAPAAPSVLMRSTSPPLHQNPVAVGAAGSTPDSPPGEISRSASPVRQPLAAALPPSDIDQIGVFVPDSDQ